MISKCKALRPTTRWSWPPAPAARLARVLALAAIVALAGAATARAQDAEPIKLRFGGDPGQTRVVLELDQPVQSDVLADGAGDGHVALAFSRLRVGDDLLGQGKGLVRTWRLRRTGGRATLTLDLKGHGRIRRRFLLPPSDGVGVYRYVVDIQADGVADAAPSPPLRLMPLRRSISVPPPPMVTPVIDPQDSDPDRADDGAGPASIDSPEARRPRDAAPAYAAKKVVVIDAGHGGHDPGALGGQAQEKAITLAAAKALRDRLERSGRYKVVMTRDSDVYVPLEGRVTVARSSNADLFISLHADSGDDPKVRGATVYTLSDHGVDRAMHSAMQSDSFMPVQLPSRDRSVKEILLDLTQRTTRNRSGAFAETLLEHIGTRTALLQRSHRDAGYMVLLAPDVPAVLLEMGFITNPEDESHLTDPRRREQLMDAVADAIDAYFRQDSQAAAR
jgi:N-acetylmuramoyl-L-alanine amidase